MNSKQTPKQAYIAWCGVALFFLYQYVLRIAPDLVEPEIRNSFLMTSNHFSELGAFFVFAYAIAQIPCGILIDRLGVRSVVLYSILLCLVGNGLLIIGNSLWEAQVSRLFMGIGSACAYISCIKVAVDNFSDKNRGFFIGAAFTFGLLGPLITAHPFAILIETTDWRYAFTVLSVCGVILWFSLVLTMPREIIKHNTNHKWSGVKKNILHIFKTPTILAYAVISTCFYSPLSLIADFSGVSFLMKNFCIECINASNITMQIYIGAIVSSLIVPWFCERYKEYNRGIVYSWIGMVGCLLMILFCDEISWYVLVVTLIILGVFSSSEILCFGAAVQSSTPETSGTTLGVINTFSVAGSAVIMQFIGFMLELKSKGDFDEHGKRIYSNGEYIFATKTILVFTIALGLIAFFIYKKGKHQKIRPKKRGE